MSDFSRFTPLEIKYFIRETEYFCMERYRSGCNELDSKSEWMPEIVSKIVIINKFL